MITRSLYYRCESVLLSECYRKIVNVATSWHLKKSSKVTRLFRILFYPIANHLKDTTPFTRPSAVNALGGDTDQKLLSEGIQ